MAPSSRELSSDSETEGVRETAELKGRVPDSHRPFGAPLGGTKGVCRLRYFEPTALVRRFVGILLQARLSPRVGHKLPLRMAIP